MIEWRYSQLTITKKNIMLISFPSSVRKSVGNKFSGNLETYISKKFPSLSTLEIPHGDSELSKL